MNLIDGKTVASPQERDEALNGLEEMLLDTLGKGGLNIEIVLDACDELARAVGEEHIMLLESVGIPHEKAREYIREARARLQRSSLVKRLETELGEKFSLTGKQSIVRENGLVVKEKIMPLGVLLHIAAGNQYGLAFYSVIEGLLTGNINIVKLPGGDDGLSGFILAELFKAEPRLKEYVYLFDYGSEDEWAIQRLMDVADAVVVWGGDGAIQAVRAMAKPDTGIIEWGHKLSFAYITHAGLRTEPLKGLAEHIVKTNQLLCSSCQGLYLDTDSMYDIYGFCKQFSLLLEECRNESPEALPIEIQAQTGLLAYTESLKTQDRPCTVFRGGQTALLAYEDDLLEPSILYGNCWVKRLPRDRILGALKPHKRHLQTAGLLCADQERPELTGLLWDA
ncbi:MAG: acyl-CoA reductase, partial [Clostridiales bacterium]|nr:acyl-CoA reductase [Clostridiales bacterium]